MAARGWRAVCACEGRRPSLPDSGAWRRKAGCVFPSPSPPPAREDAPRPRDAPAGCRGSGRGRRGGCLPVLRAGTRQRQTLGRGTWATARGRHAGATRPRAQRGAPGARPRSAARPPKLGERAGGARRAGAGAAGAAGDLARLLGAPLPGRCGPHAPAAGRPRPGTSGARGASGRCSKGGLRGGGARRGPDSCRGGGRGAPRRPAPPSRPPSSRSLQPIRRAPRAGGVGLPIKRRGAVTPRAGCAAPRPEPASQTRGV